ncbi:P-II family nitrogen regulator [Pectinatus brassicae]|uniref:Nitrogen regulatory protein P-II 1 n=1 Tax=Pectinatus brassicae TaxID=862415 RepID=A0A840UVK7_9FIRM|nr:P-II family nitrogen regulator [Pectinatus brassicae]MBB5336854.1 nitrogen regulatory protein P-II 1 [Pectinatus brassicae]
MAEKLYKVDIITRPEKLEDFKEKMNEIGVTGMTVSNVYGCGLQQGHIERYRGNIVDISLHPKIKIEIVIYETPVEALIKAAKEILYTGKIGDGKIFVYEINNAVKIRTGEEGGAAIVDNK